ncbi:MAG: dehydrogenase [Alphaproteobacteria bacterium]|nr:dehydrogenase [Alphaproteobacteria bacterium]
MTLIRARAPLRLGLAGGGTDVSPYCDVYGGYVLNATIDRYAYAIIRTLKDPIVRFHAADRDCREEFSLDAWAFTVGQLNLHRAVYAMMVREYNGGRPLAVEITTFCDAPPGSGLGSSSTLVIAMVRAFVELLNLPLDDYKIAKLAFEIERIDCRLEGGRQDQYSAAFGGFNFMEFYADERAVINPLRIKNCIISEIEASLILFYTGLSRESAKIISDQSANVMAGTQQTIDAMHQLKQEAVLMKECLLRADYRGMVDSMREGWENKKRLASSVTNAYIDEVYEAAVSSGARAGKVSGAGGGGFMMFFAPPELRMDVMRAIGRFHGQLSNCHFTKDGASAWRP